jgi:hypothetical protein
MLHIDALYFLLFLEAFVLSVLLSGYLYYRIRKGYKSEAAKTLVENLSDLREGIEGHLAKIRQPGDEDNDSLEGRLAREKQSLVLKFLSVSLDGVAKHGQHHNLFWEHLYKGYEDIVQDFLTMKKELLIEIASLHERMKIIEDSGTDAAGKGDDKKLLAENEQLRAEMKRLEENVDAKAKALIDLQTKFEALEQEYLVLYKESMANNP